MPRRVVRHEVVQPLDQSYRLIPLTQGQNAIVDAEDFELLSQIPWFADWCENTRSFYAKVGHRNSVRMHRFLCNCRATREQVDHINGNTLDNRRNNLRKCSQEQNAKNRRTLIETMSGFKGVCSIKRSGRARIGIGSKKRITIGFFATAKDAAKAYDEAAKKYHGEFANLNFP